MSMIRLILFTVLGLFAMPVLAHVGTEVAGQHFVEHLLIGLLLAAPVAYGLLRLWQKSHKD